MPKRDIRSNLKPILVMNSNITTDTVTNSEIIDTAHYDGGVKFNFLCVDYTAGTFTPEIYEGNDAAMADETAVEDKNLIPQTGAETGAVISAVTANGATPASIGIFGTKRYIRIKITSASTGGARIVITAEVMPEILKAV